MNKEMTPTSKGQEIVSLLRHHNKISPTLIPNEELTAEDGTKSFWPTFIVFPQELSTVFPGSYISPKDFLTELKYNKQDVDIQQNYILGNNIGDLDSPSLKTEQQNGNNSFSLTVLNGLTNENALEMTKYAKLGFSKAENRAGYQHHMYKSIEKFYDNETPPDYGIRIFDDCLASGDSIAGYLYKLDQENNQLLKQGVEIMVVTATAQSILFLKSFAQSLGIKLSIKVGQLAFGLSNGTPKEDGVIKHANYITYPDELLKLLPREITQQLKSYQVKIDEEELIQVVGDMGEFEKGIKLKEMLGIRKKIEKEVDELFCWWNDHREDPHGEHPNGKNKLTVAKPSGYSRMAIYLARGGYLPYIWDKMKYRFFKEVDTVIVRASRLWTKEYGYGVGINNDF